MSDTRKGLRAQVRVSGRVQGVWFRTSACETARSLGLTGYVRNLPDGSVEAVFEGPESAVRRAVSWCYQGPPLASVETVDVNWGEPTGRFSDFSVRF